jgi:hypothetical protein
MPKRKPIPRIDRDREKMANIIRKHMKMMPSMVDEALKKTVNGIAKEMTAMDTKEEALEKARDWTIKRMIDLKLRTGVVFSAGIVHVYAWNKDGVKVDWHLFEFLRQEVPPQGSIVEVWDDDEESRQVAYSSGEIDGNGCLLVEEEYRLHCYQDRCAAWKNWRVIKEAGEE